MFILSRPLAQQGGIFPRPGLKPPTPVLRLLSQPRTCNVLTALLILPTWTIRMIFDGNVQAH